jgi:hypothetical protein
VAQTRRCITAFTAGRTGSCPEPVESNPSPQNTSLRSIMIPLSHLRFGLPSGLFLSDFHTKSLYTFHSSPMRTTFPAHLLRLDLICLMISRDEYKLCTKSHIHFPVLTLYQTIRPVPRLCVVFRNKYRVLWWGVVSPKLKDNPLSDVQDCLFNIFAATLYIWRPSPLSASRGRAMPW